MKAHHLKTACAIIVIVAGAASSARAGRPQRRMLLDRVVARVDGEIITENELLMAAFGDFRRAETLLPGTFPDVRETLKNMIDDRLIEQAARREVKEIPQERIASRVEAMVKRVRARFPSEQAFVDALEQRGWDLESYKRYLRREEERNYVINFALARRVRLTDEDVREFERQLRQKGESLTQYRLRHILVAVPAKAPPAVVRQAERKVLGLLEDVRKGVPFEQLARDYSDDDSTRRSGGDLGWIGEKELRPAILKAVRGLKEGQVSTAVRTDKGFHIFRLVRKRGARERLFEKRMEEERRKWAEKLRRRAQIKILVPELAE